MEIVLQISLKLNFTQNTLGCCGLIRAVLKLLIILVLKVCISFVFYRALNLHQNLEFFCFVCFVVFLKP